MGDDTSHIGWDERWRGQKVAESGESSVAAADAGSDMSSQTESTLAGATKILRTYGFNGYFGKLAVPALKIKDFHFSSVSEESPS